MSHVGQHNLRADAAVFVPVVGEWNPGDYSETRSVSDAATSLREVCRAPFKVPARRSEHIVISPRLFLAFFEVERYIVVPVPYAGHNKPELEHDIPAEHQAWRQTAGTRLQQLADRSGNIADLVAKLQSLADMETGEPQTSNLQPERTAKEDLSWTLLTQKARQAALKCMREPNERAVEAVIARTIEACEEDFTSTDQVQQLESWLRGFLQGDDESPWQPVNDDDSPGGDASDPAFSDDASSATSSKGGDFEDLIYQYSR